MCLESIGLLARNMIVLYMSYTHPYIYPSHLNAVAMLLYIVTTSPVRLQHSSFSHGTTSFLSRSLTFLIRLALVVLTLMIRGLPRLGQDRRARTTRIVPDLIEVLAPFSGLYETLAPLGYLTGILARFFFFCDSRTISIRLFRSRPFFLCSLSAASIRRLLSSCDWRLFRPFSCFRFSRS